MAKAWQRSPDGTRLVYILREDDFEEVWKEDGGFTRAADEPHEFRPRAPRLFKDLALGEIFRRGASSDQVFEKVDAGHARNVDVGNVFEMDPYDGAYAY